MYPVERAYRLTPFAHKLTYCNYVVDGATRNLPSYASDEPFILVMGGGGKDGICLAKAFLEALPTVLEETQLQAVILTGPNMPSSDREVLLPQSTFHPVQVLNSFEDASPWLQKASAVVTMGGYNSLGEVLELRKKALVVPRAGPSAEQRIRTQVFSQRRLIRMLNPDVLTPKRLAHELLGLLSDDSVPDLANIPPMDGAQRAAMLLLGKASLAKESRLEGRQATTG